MGFYPHFFRRNLFSGCGSSSDATNTSTVQTTNDTSKIDYTSLNTEDSDLAKYTNADWLFQNYFGEYGLPQEMKHMMMPELMLMANGFALQHAKGEDVESSISELHSAMQMLQFSGQLNMMVQGMEENYESGLLDNNITYDPVEERILDAEAQSNVAIAEKLNEDYAKAQKELVEKYGLPYIIPNNDTQTITYSQSMKSSGKNSKKKVKKHSGIDSWAWFEADFTWVNGAAGIGHVGLVYDAWRTRKYIVDANTGAGVALHEKSLDEWSNNGGWSRIEGHYYNGWSQYDSARTRAVNYAKNKAGITPYNWNFFDKNSDSRTYCSQLVWKAYKSQGVDIDYDGGYVVWPNDLKKHSNVYMFNSSQL